jgi:hypothetical protein
MAEWLKAHAWKACLLERVTWVRIPLSPPVLNDLADPAISLQSVYGSGPALLRRLFACQSIGRERDPQHHRLRAEVEPPVRFVAIPDPFELEDTVFERSYFDFLELAVLPFAVNLR